jgi:hypothetical protein
MTVEGYKGYREGQDILQIPVDYLTYPSKNCLVYKGKVVSRLGIKNDGNAPTENTPIHSEYVWKKAKGGAKSLRVWGNTLQVKWNGVWITIFEGFNANTTRVRFASWTDTNGAIIKNRLYMVDGTDKIFEWTGAIATVAPREVGDADELVRISDTRTLLQLGFDAGDVTPQTVKIVSLDANGQPDNTTDYTHADNLTNNDRLTLTSIPSPTPVEGDIIIAGVKTHTDKLSSIDKDDIYTFQNRVFIANFDSGRIYYSHAIDYLEFTIPATQTAITAGFLDLDGNYTAMIERKSVLWISTEDDWYKVTMAIEENAYGYWTTVEKFEASESVGALPYAVAIQKGDVVFMAQDKRLRRIITLEILGIDDIELISDQIDGLLDRMDLVDVRIYYYRRYIYIISATEGITLMLDILSGEFMPPQYIGMKCLSVIDGVLYGHSNGRNETFYLFRGRNDLGGQLEVKIAVGFTHSKDNFVQKKHSQFAHHARATDTSKVSVEYQYEEFGAGVDKLAEYDVKDIKKYEMSNDVSFGANPFASYSLAGVDDEVDGSLKGFFLFDTQERASWFDFRPVWTITGTDVEFHLLAWAIDEERSDDNVPDDLFINRE